MKRCSQPTPARPLLPTTLRACSPTVAAILGSWLPIVWLAYRGHVPLLPRLKGAWFLMGADVIGAAIPVGAACLWIALREPDPRA